MKAVRRSKGPTVVDLQVRNSSTRKRVYRRVELQALAEHVCTEEGAGPRAEVSLLFCDDAFIATLNRDFRHEDHATDVLSFPQPNLPAGDTVLLGDIVISLETVETRCAGDRAAMREEIRLLFCHGLLHLLGYDHDTDDAREDMTARQARYLGVPADAAWKE
ncbi:MAG: rRNA maturation RNase YbeY [FCB group bacterium]|jgi:probable rRNA maturation factor|nr:rRNA maturation RNase YbeY [FCB group bacterium]